MKYKSWKNKYSEAFCKRKTKKRKKEKKKKEKKKKKKEEEELLEKILILPIEKLDIW